MTTDITELAQRVKTETSAIDDTQWYLAKPSEIRLLVEALEKAQTGEKQWREVVDAFCAAAADVLAERQRQCRAAMLAAAPHEVQVVPEKIEQSRKRVDRCDVCTEGARGGCGTCIFNGNFE